MSTSPCCGPCLPVGISSANCGPLVFTCRSKTALWEAGIQLRSADQLSPPLETPLQGGEISASLQRSQEIVIQSQENTVHTRVLASTVGEAFALTFIFSFTSQEAASW